MNISKKFHTKRSLLVIDIAFIILGFIYFLFFVNKGLILADEGYYVHYAERIANGEIPYRDFVLQYSPGYFYLLAFLFKIFGVQILVGRFISLLACIGILISIFAILRLYKINSVYIHVLSALVIISLTYPLLHIPLVIWVCVLFSLQLVIVYVLWLRQRKYIFILLLGLLLGLTLLFRQNIGALYILLINVLVVLGSGKEWRRTIFSLISLNSIWIALISIFAVLYFLAAGNFSGIVTMIAMSKQFIDTYPFSYPPLIYLFQPTGFFKLLPYYFPIFFLLLVVWNVLKKQFRLEKLAFAIIAISGFFVTVYPASDLLHVYPFLGVSLIAALVFFYGKPVSKIIYLLLPLFIIMGVYLTFVGQSYRYEGYYLKENTQLNLAKTSGILIDNTNSTMTSLPALYKFIDTNTKKNDYIFVYPFSPMLYYVLDRQNPNGIVQYVLLEAGSIYPEERVLREIMQKRVKYIITVGPYIYDKKISSFIQEQKMVYTVGPYIIFDIKE